VQSSLPNPADSPITIVDDDPEVLDVLRRALERLGYPVTAHADPLEALAAIEAGASAHLLIVDKSMPGADGLTVARRALEVDPSTVTLVITGEADVESAVEALRIGAVDYLLKPLDLDVLAAAVQRALLARAQALFHREVHGRLREEVEAKAIEVERQNARLEELTIASLSGLVQLLEARSSHFQSHSEEVSRVAVGVARRLGVAGADLEAIRIAGLLHDIGMISVPDTILNKGEDLTPQEIEFVREHTRLAERVLRPFTHLGPAVDYVLAHHERLDGSGYPLGLAGKQVSLGAQVVGVADVYVALTETRPFRDAVSAEEALSTLRGAEGMWFSGRVLDALEAAALEEAVEA
jgi:putative nucleotidyltransferase with HDIG domain